MCLDWFYYIIIACNVAHQLNPLLWQGILRLFFISALYCTTLGEIINDSDEPIERLGNKGSAWGIICGFSELQIYFGDNRFSETLKVLICKDIKGFEASRNLFI
jgi:hypothetical protein